MQFLSRLYFGFLSFIIIPAAVQSQSKIDAIKLTANNNLSSFAMGQRNYALPNNVPFISYCVNKKSFSNSNPSSAIQFSYNESSSPDGELKWILHFKNISKDTITLDNIHPFSFATASAVITGLGDNGLSRTHLFFPGRTPVNVIVPDNAWELGYGSLKSDDGNTSVAALVRRARGTIKQGGGGRFETVLYPEGSVDYNFFAVSFNGDWQNGLTKVFQEKMLFDKYPFNDSLFHRKDLQWIRNTYILHLLFAWDKRYYDIADGKFHMKDLIERGKKLYGGDDIVSVWPTWPTLGLDQRNQFDLFDDLPGGLPAMKQQAELCRSMGAKFFICYNPWDESTNSENHFDGLSYLVKGTSADGIVLDTKAEAGKELQNAADKVRKGVIMYSEGMAVPKDMEGIVSGRVHNALYYPPMLNLNKLLKPEFTIYRVAEISKEKIQREYATSFFNGYGTELNIMTAGEPDWAEEQFKYLGRTTRILRENTFNFVNRGYTPLLQTTTDSIWVNKWTYQNKTIYTIYSILPQGYKGSLFEIQPAAGTHFVDLWHHRLLTPSQVNNKWMIAAQTEAFNASDLGTNNEGNVDCIAQLPQILTATIDGDELKITTTQHAGEIRVWAGNPDYAKEPVVLKAQDQTISLQKKFGRFEGNFIIQYMEAGILKDETIVDVVIGVPRRVSVSQKTKAATTTPQGMVKIPGGTFKFTTTNGDEFIRYPNQDEGKIFNIPALWMDQFPVTNIQFDRFLKATHYKPTDAANFLKHWKGGKIPAGQENFPVIYVSYEDAVAYAKWTGKRLPTEIEWQYAAQANDGREWPWDQTIPVKRRNENVTNTLTVVHLEGIDSTLCNLGNGKLYPVGSYPRGANPYQLQDLVGCVWQLTNDEYMQESHRLIILKGGSYFKPSGSWWYVQGGPRELNFRQYLLRVSQGFERNATVGFRCVKDAK